MRQVLILFPRLDCSFKKGHVPEKIGPPNHPLRHHFNTFLKKLVQVHLDKGDQVVVDQRALWQFDPNRYKNDGWDLIYIPHKQKYQFDVGDAGRYYMQQVIPTIFSIDKEGWGADLSDKPIPVSDRGAFDMLKKRIETNTSKFAQPMFDKSFKDRDYVFFPCQLPHDETIKYHSDVSVYQALLTTLEWAYPRNIKVWVKGHPANPGSMGDLRNLTNQYSNAEWTDNMSIHQLIRNSLFVTLVNSGVGIEALLHEKNVAAFGRADYVNNNGVVFKVRGSSDLTDIADLIKTERIMPYPYPTSYEIFKRAIQGWYDKYFDVENPETFSKI